MSLMRRFVWICGFVLFAALVGCSGEVKIGGIISESGAVEAYGAAAKKGMDLALEELNAEGGFNGKPISIVYKDDATNAQIGQQVTKELIEDEGIKMIIGAISSTVTLAIAPQCEEAGAILLSPAASATSVSNAGDWIFRNYPSDQLEGTAMAKFAKEELGAERVVIFAYDNDWGTGLAEVFKKQYEGRFRSVEKSFMFDESMMDQVPAWVEETKALDPDAVYVIGYDQELLTLLQAFESAELDAIRMSTSSVTPAIGRRAGSAAQNMVYPQTVFDLESTDPEVASFVADYRAKYNEDPDLYAAHGYDAVKVLHYAMTEANSTHPKSVKGALISLENFDGAAGATSFDSAGDVVRYPRIFAVRDGEPVPYDQLKEQGGSLFE